MTIIANELTGVSAVKFMATDITQVYFNTVKVFESGVAPEGDPHWENVVALLHFDGDLVDEASSQWDVASGSIGFEGGVFGEALRPYSTNLVSPSSPEITDLRGHDFTIEFFIKPSGAGNQTILASNQTGGLIAGTLVRLTSSRSILFTHLGQPVNLLSSTLPSDVFTHVAICWDSNSRRIYVNGVLDAEDTIQSGWTTGGQFPLRIGRYQTAPADYLQSTIDELRVTKGVARYTENFTPPTEPFPNF